MQEPSRTALTQTLSSALHVGPQPHCLFSAFTGLLASPLLLCDEACNLASGSSGRADWTTGTQRSGKGEAHFPCISSPSWSFAYQTVSRHLRHPFIASISSLTNSFVETLKWSLDDDIPSRDFASVCNRWKMLLSMASISWRKMRASFVQEDN
jgi:hypothetical protein